MQDARGRTTGPAEFAGVRLLRHERERLEHLRAELTSAGPAALERLTLALAPPCPLGREGCACCGPVAVTRPTGAVMLHAAVELSLSLCLRALHRALAELGRGQGMSPVEKKTGAPR